ncbi:MAG: molybdate ABC transporter substrate-binding protein [Saprospiraceae bacterium]|nr:molybdate ABC transporter substrate-binding protein [Saprospiraceae bacterium]
MSYNKIITVQVLWVLGTFWCISCQFADDHKKHDHREVPSIMIAVAANMQFAMDELILAFTKDSGTECEVTISSSGKLTAQIQQGAPFDIFVSANMKYPNTIAESGLAVGAPKVYAHGKLVLWTMREDLDPVPESLLNASVRHIALANPETAPYGEAALQILRNLNLWDILQKKLVFGESIAQTNQFVMTKAADIGFTAMSVVLSPELVGKGYWKTIPSDLYHPIEQGVVIINRDGGNTGAAQKFYDFLSSDRAKAILLRFGYDTDQL